MLQRAMPAHASALLSSEQVWHAFFLHALLQDAAERSQPLVLPNSGDHNSRLKHAMEQRNLRIVRQGQREKMHACDICCKFIPGSGFKGLSRPNYM